MATSATAVTDRCVNRTCNNCGFDGLVTEVIDPDGPYSCWECPTCLTSHDTTEAVFFDGPDPDDARDRELEDLHY